MKGKFLIIMAVLLLLAVTAVSANTNDTVDALAQSDDAGLEKTYFYDEDTGEKILDDTVETENVVKYYGDKDTKFKVTVYDDDYDPMNGVYVSFGKDWASLKEKTTNKKGNVYFPINNKVGKHKVMTYIECEDYDDGTTNLNYYMAKNTVTVKTTIVSKTLTKYITQKDKKFKIKFLNTKGKILKGKKVTLKIGGKKYRLKTDSKGYVDVTLNRLKSGKHKITAYNPVSKEKRKISAYIYKKGEVNTATVKIIDSDYFKTKRLKTGDIAWTVYEPKKGRQYQQGAYVQLVDRSGGLDLPAHTKLLKAKFYFKDSHGKVVTKTSSNVYYDSVGVHLIKGYTPYKVKIWYKTK